jgi:hypothetical protein
VRLFTLDEAEALLPEVREELEAMRRAKAELDLLREALAGTANKAASNGHVTDADAVAGRRGRAERLAEEINHRLERFQSWGCELKGIDEGLVDFPSERDGRVVYLCWQVGEERIAWWHDTESGFAGRQPL